VRQAQASDPRCEALPDITLTLGGQDYVLTGSDYGFQKLGQCQLCVQGSEQSIWILGDVFHRKFPVTYDFGSEPPMIGLPPGTRHSWGFQLLGVLMLVLVAISVLGARLVRRYFLRRAGQRDLQHSQAAQQQMPVRPVVDAGAAQR